MVCDHRLCDAYSALLKQVPVYCVDSWFALRFKASHLCRLRALCAVRAFALASVLSHGSMLCSLIVSRGCSPCRVPQEMAIYIDTAREAYESFVIYQFCFYVRVKMLSCRVADCVFCAFICSSSVRNYDGVAVLSGAL